MDNKVVMPTDNGEYKAGEVREPKVSVEGVNEAIEKVAPELTEKQRKKQEQQAKNYWNSMITRKEATELVQQVTDGLQQQMQLLFVQNRTLLEILDKKGLATTEEINEHSKVVLESMFGPPPEKTEEGNGEVTEQ